MEAGNRIKFSSKWSYQLQILLKETCEQENLANFVFLFVFLLKNMFMIFVVAFEKYVYESDKILIKQVL